MNSKNSWITNFNEF